MHVAKETYICAVSLVYTCDVSTCVGIYARVHSSEPHKTASAHLDLNALDNQRLWGNELVVSNDCDTSTFSERATDVDLTNQLRVSRVFDVVGTYVAMQPVRQVQEPVRADCRRNNYISTTYY